ncbi:MAG: sugar phosphate isomerase/epimerase family protein [Betaproteobacteria bacterium]
MELGYRIIRPEDVGTQPLSLAQISLWRTAKWDVSEGDQAVEEAIEIARECKRRGIRTVFHPLEYPLAAEHAEQTLDVMRRLSAAADLGIIVHDEGGASGQRLSNDEADRYAESVREISGHCRVSIENSYNSGDITWFWERFAAPGRVSMTLDIGHLELSGIDSVAFVRNMPQRLVERVAFVHMHHHDPQERQPVKDHKPLVAGCREIGALKELLRRKRDIQVILELDASEEGMRQSITLLKNL